MSSRATVPGYRRSPRPRSCAHSPTKRCIRVSKRAAGPLTVRRESSAQDASAKHKRVYTNAHGLCEQAGPVRWDEPVTCDASELVLPALAASARLGGAGPGPRRDSEPTSSEGACQWPGRMFPVGRHAGRMPWWDRGPRAPLSACPGPLPRRATKSPKAPFNNPPGATWPSKWRLSSTCRLFRQPADQ